MNQQEYEIKRSDLVAKKKAALDNIKETIKSNKYYKDIERQYDLIIKQLDEKYANEKSN